MHTLEFQIPLPPSKNARTVRKGVFVKGKLRNGLRTQGRFINVPVLSPAVLDYRAEVKRQIGHHAGVLPADEKIIVECVWYRTDRRADVHNYHAELADAIAPALGLNDKWFLIRDMDLIDVPKDQGKVWVQMRPSSAVFDK